MANSLIDSDVALNTINTVYNKSQLILRERNEIYYVKDASCFYRPWFSYECYRKE